MKLGKQFEKYAYDPVKTIEKKLNKQQIKNIKEWMEKIVREVDDSEMPIILIDWIYNEAYSVARHEVLKEFIPIKKLLKTQLQEIGSTKKTYERLIEKINEL